MARVTAVQRKNDTDLLEGEESYAVQGLARGLLVMRVFRPGEIALSNAEIAARTGLPRPTVSRLTETLTALGYLSYLPGSGRYSLGAAVVSLCHSLLAGLPYRIAARPILENVAEAARLPTSLGARDQLDMINVETVRPEGARAARFDLGARLPIETTAIGRAYIAGLSPPEREVLLDRIRQRRRGNWPRIKEGIEAAHASIRQRGFCISSDWRPDVIGVGAPVVTAHGAVFAINCGGHPAELTRARAEKDVGPRVARAAELIKESTE